MSISHCPTLFLCSWQELILQGLTFIRNSSSWVTVSFSETVTCHMYRKLYNSQSILTWAISLDLGRKGNKVTIPILQIKVSTERTEVTGLWNSETGVISLLQAQHSFHCAPLWIFKHWLSNSLLDWPRLRTLKASANPPHLSSLSPTPPLQLLAAILSVLPHTQPFLPHATPFGSATCPSFLFAPAPSSQFAAFQNQKAFKDWLHLSGSCPRHQPLRLGGHCPTLHLTTGSSERGFFGSWCGCDLGSPGKTKALRQGLGLPVLWSPQDGLCPQWVIKAADCLTGGWTGWPMRLTPALTRGYTTTTSASATVWSSPPNKPCPVVPLASACAFLSEMSFSPFSTWKTTINLLRT